MNNMYDDMYLYEKKKFCQIKIKHGKSKATFFKTFFIRKLSKNNIN